MRALDPVRSRKASGDKKSTILESARQLFRQHGYKRTSMDDIAHEAGVAKGTLYIYFPSKEQLFIAVSQQFHSSMMAKLREAGALNLPLAEKMIALMDARIGEILRWKSGTPHAQDLIATYQRLVEADESSSYEEFRGLVARALKDGIREGEADPKAAGLSFDAALDTLIAVAAGAAWRSNPKIFDEQLSRSLRLCLKGMQA